MITRRGLFRSLLAGSAIAGVAIAKPTMDLQPTGIVFQKSTEWPTIQLSTLLEISGNGWNQNPQLEQAQRAIVKEMDRRTKGQRFEIYELPIPLGMVDAYKMPHGRYQIRRLVSYNITKDIINVRFDCAVRII